MVAIANALEWPWRPLLLFKTLLAPIPRKHKYGASRGFSAVAELFILSLDRRESLTTCATGLQCTIVSVTDRQKCDSKYCA